ncbi:MAG: excinuclease ABC subunit UvrC [Lachnospiraceae bacterium]|nr:excinuclease ABC subunit UvrC [Lachnospiraceae bacterium]
MFDIEEELKKLPDDPGVYIMHDSSDGIIYIGKAKSLTKRVHQYFQTSHDEGIKKKQMVEHIAWFEYIITDSELEALVLECNLIKEHRPKYNTMLRDDKTYPYIKVTLGEPFPRVLFSRITKKDRSRYFGPFSSPTAVKDTIDLVQKLFMIRNCNRKLPETIGKERPCLNYHMKQCQGVCQGYISREEYLTNVERAMRFLNGDDKEILSELTQKMQEASDDMDFERAAQIRDQINSVKFCTQKQKITNTNGDDQDIVAFTAEGEDACAVIFYIRNGKLIGRDHFFMKTSDDISESEGLKSFLQQFYSGTPLIPHEIYAKCEPEDKESIEKWLSSRRGQKVTVSVPKRGQKARLVELAEKNAKLVLSNDREKIKKEAGRTIGAMREISKLLDISDINRLEAYDISNTSGYQSVGSMVVFEHGKPLRSDYRKFRLKTVKGPDDYKSMREVLTRRFTHGREERSERREKGLDENEGSFTRFPDVIMMDGGRGQVNIALDVLRELSLDIPVCGMVKDDHHRTRGLYYNNVEIPIDKHSEGFKLITRLQDEAHRFAIEYHRSLRGAYQVHSFLDDIEGIGKTRRNALMKAYESAEKMHDATIDELANVSSMNMLAAEKVYEYMHRK